MKKIIRWIGSWIEAAVDTLAGPDSHAEVRYSEQRVRELEEENAYLLAIIQNVTDDLAEAQRHLRGY